MDGMYYLMLAMIVVGGLTLISGVLGVCFRKKAPEKNRKKLVFLSVFLMFFGGCCLIPPTVYIITLGNENQNIDVGYEKSLEGAASIGDYDRVYELLEKGADPDQTYLGAGGDAPIIHAAVNGDVDMVKLLLEYGADPNTETAEKMTPLIYSVYEAENIEMTNILLEYGADINHKTTLGSTATHEAASASNISALGFLMDKGADINAVTNDGRTILYSACTTGTILPSIWVVKLCVDRGLDPKITLNDKTLTDVLEENRQIYLNTHKEDEDFNKSAIDKTYKEIEDYLKTAKKVPQTTVTKTTEQFKTTTNEKTTKAS